MMRIRGRLVPCTKKGARPFFPRAAFPSSPCRPAIPFLSLSLRFVALAWPQAITHQLIQLLFDESFPPSSAIRTLVFIGGSCGLLLQSACMAWEWGATPWIGGAPTQHDSGIIFCTSLAALPSHQLCGSLSRGTLFVPPRRSSLSPHCHHQAPDQLRSHFRLSSVTGFK